MTISTSSSLRLVLIARIFSGFFLSPQLIKLPTKIVGVVRSPQSIVVRSSSEYLSLDAINSGQLWTVLAGGKGQGFGVILVGL